MDEPTPDPKISPEEASTPERRCGRCQRTFPGDPDLQHASAQLGWWMCAPCREALVGHQAAGRW
jgi:hypothetical protein